MQFFARDFGDFRRPNGDTKPALNFAEHLLSYKFAVYRRHETAFALHVVNIALLLQLRVSSCRGDDTHLQVGGKLTYRGQRIVGVKPAAQNRLFNLLLDLLVYRNA